MRRSTVFLLALGITTASSVAFHDGGVAHCDGCHVTHEGSVAPGANGDAALLIDVSPSDVCLRCHAGGAGAVLGSDPLVPPSEKGAGNFVFLLEDNLNDAPDGMTQPIPGDAAGHTVVAPGRGLVADPRHSVAPGGSFPSSQLGCTSCHDPHGNAGFRSLNGVGPVQDGLTSFSFPAPQAVGIGLSGTESTTSHTAYTSGMSAWCANCHGPYHDGAGSGFEHPSDVSLGSEISARYNAYDGDANPVGGSFATSYLPQVPFEDPTGSGLPASTTGPTATSRVMCLTCHRAHGSSAPHAGRWDFNVSLLKDDGIVSGSHALADPYADDGQGSLCNKCHESGPLRAAPDREATGRRLSAPRGPRTRLN